MRPGGLSKELGVKKEARLAVPGTRSNRSVEEGGVKATGTTDMSTLLVSFDVETFASLNARACVCVYVCVCVCLCGVANIVYSWKSCSWL